MIHKKSLCRIFSEVKEEGFRGPEQPCCCEDRRKPSDEEIGKKAVQNQRKERRANGGCLGYPEAMKDVVSCEKARGTANRY